MMAVKCDGASFHVSVSDPSVELCISDSMSHIPKKDCTNVLSGNTTYEVTLAKLYIFVTVYKPVSSISVQIY